MVKTIYKRIKKGEDYKQLKRTIVILIADFDIEELKNLKYHSKWKIIEENERKHILTEDLEFHIIQLPKMYKLNAEGKEKKLIEWLYFLNNPESKEVQGYMEKNENMKQAKEKLDNMSDDQVVRRLAELREKAILDEREAEYTGYSKGMRDGVQQGTTQAKKEIARKMKQKGAKVEEIMEITGLTKQEVGEL